MKRYLAAALVALVALVAVTAALANHKPGHPTPRGHANQQNGDRKVTICHRTGSTTNPHRTIRISRRAWENAHSEHHEHGDTEGACQNGEPRGSTALDATLTPVSGASGSGSAHVDVRLLRNAARVCYTLRVSGVDATAAHIHTSVAFGSFQPNDIVVPLKTPNRSGRARGCTRVTRAIGEAILAHPGNFYVNVHSAAFPNGQVQGTLTAS
jgi:hypothetical protein